MTSQQPAGAPPKPATLLSPTQLLHHLDTGDLWPALPNVPEEGGLHKAYQIARHVEALRAQRGEVARGYKIGFTNFDMWARYGVAAPI